MMEFTKYFNRYPGTFNVDLFFSFPVKLLEDFNVNLKFRSKFNRGFINHDCLDCAFKKLSTILRYQEPTRQEAVNFSFKMFKMGFLRSLKC